MFEKYQNFQKDPNFREKIPVIGKHKLKTNRIKKQKLLKIKSKFCKNSNFLQNRNSLKKFKCKKVQNTNNLHFHTQKSKFQRKSPCFQKKTFEKIKAFEKKSKLSINVKTFKKTISKN